MFVAIEAGASSLRGTFDGGRTWRDRVRGGPYDTHTAVTDEPCIRADSYSAAGDGYFESTDAGDSWKDRSADGLKHLYLVGVAGVDPADPDAVIVSATDGPWSAYSVAIGRGVHRLSEDWARAMGAVNERPAGVRGEHGQRLGFATHAGEPGVIYASNNRGLFKSG